jgi:hypothetical protein
MSFADFNIAVDLTKRKNLSPRIEFLGLPPNQHSTGSGLPHTMPRPPLLTGIKLFSSRLRSKFSSFRQLFARSPRSPRRLNGALQRCGSCLPGDPSPSRTHHAVTPLDGTIRSEFSCSVAGTNSVTLNLFQSFHSSAKQAIVTVVVVPLTRLTRIASRCSQQQQQRGFPPHRISLLARTIPLRILASPKCLVQ